MDDSFQAKSNAFLAWFLRHPSASVFPGISLEDYRRRDAGRAVVALQDIPEDVELFSVSRESILSVAASKLSSILPHDALGDDPWQRLILVLIYEHLQGPNSPWKPYLDMLPKDHFNTLMYWSDAELEELQASTVRNKIGRAAADQMIRKHVVATIERYPDVFFPAAVERLAREEIESLGHRMGSTIMAYAFDLESDQEKNVDEDGYATDDEDVLLPKAMVPLADMLNADVDYNARLFNEPDILVMRSTRPIRQGDQILNDYGPLPRADLLRRYGYITPRYARFDVVEISHDTVLEAVQEHHPLAEHNLSKRISYLEDDFLLDEGYDIQWAQKHDAQTDGPQEALDIGDVRLSEELVRVLRTLLIHDSNFKHPERLPQSQKESLDTAMRTVLHFLVTSRLRQYATTINDDEKLLKGHNLNKRRVMAIEVRLGEKRLLQMACLVLDVPPKLRADQSMNGEPARKKQRIGATG